MLAAAQASHSNGCSLREDALLLFRADRFARAAALAILSEEEFSKAFILGICAKDGRWDSNIHLALRTHSNKQGISEAMANYLDWFTDNAMRVAEMNRVTLVSSSPGLIPPQEKMEDLLGTARSRFAKPIRDYLKQDAFYVAIDEDGATKSTPGSVTKSEAEQCLETAETFQLVTEVVLGDPTAGERLARRLLGSLLDA